MWFYARNRQRMGPVSLTELQRLAAARQLQPNDMVMEEGTTKWVPASSVPNLFSVAKKDAPAHPVREAATLPPLAALAETPPLPPSPSSVLPHAETLISPGPALAKTLMPTLSPPSTMEAVLPPPSSAALGGSASACQTNVPGYEILRELGRGGMGVVYQARHLKLGRIVALKMILAGEHAGADELIRFKTEAESLARLQHQHIVQVHDVGEHEGKPFFSLEYCAGGSLERKLNSTPIAPLEAAAVVEKLARAMAAAHGKGVVHRDLKPANVLLAEDGTLKITDFGLAKKLDEESGQTKSGAIMGTPSYMAPEQAGGKAKELGPACDVYALGAILYDCLTGRPPFKAATALDTVLQVVSDEPVPPSQLNAKVGRDLETICLKCLQKPPGKRYGSATDLAEDLRRFQAGEPIAAHPVGRWERTWRWCRRNPSVASLLLVVVLLLLTGTGVSALFGLDAAAQARVAREKAKEAEELADGREQARAEEKKQRGIAEKREQTALQHLYAAQLGLSPKALAAGRMTQLGDLLDSTRPEQTGGADLRGWEWFHLHRLWRSESMRFQGHAEHVYAVSCSPDGQLAASAGARGVILVWDVDTGEARKHLEGFNDAVLTLAFSPDGKHLAAGSQDSTAAVFDLNTGRLIHRLSGHILDVNGVAYSADGEFLATAGKDNTIKIWDAKSGREEATLLGHRGEVRRVWFQRDGRRLASVGDDRVLRFWSLPDGKEEETAAFTSMTPSIALTPDQSRLAVWSRAKQAVVLMDVAARKPIAEFRGYPRSALDLSFNAAGTRLASVDEDGDAMVWEVSRQRQLSYYRAQATAVALTALGERFLSACSDGIVRVWPAVLPGLDRFVGHDGGLRRVAFHPSRRLLATGDTIGSIRLWNSETGKVNRTLGLHVAERGPEGTPPSELLKRMLASGKPMRGKQHFFDPQGAAGPDSLREAITFEGHNGEILALAFSPDGKTLASAGGDKEVFLWDVDTGEELKAFKHPQRISCLAFSPGGELLATGCWDDAVRIWNVTDGTEKRTLRGHEDNVDALAFHPDGRRLASAGVDRAIRIWDVTDGKVLNKLEGHSAWIHALALSPDGKLLASGSGDQTVRLWDFETGEPRFVLRGHTERVTSLAYHPREDRLISASNHSSDGTARVWDTKIGREILAMPAPVDRIYGLAFDPAGKRLAVTAGRRLALWEEAGREKTAPDLPLVRGPAPRPAGIEPDAGPKVLGWQRARQLPRMHAKKDDALTPTRAGQEFLVVIVSVPRGLLYPSAAQQEYLQAKARRDPDEDPAAPLRSYSLYDPKRFALIAADGKSLLASAIGPLPHAYGDASGGFNTGTTIELSTSTFDPRERSLIAAVWELPPAELTGPFQLRFDNQRAISVPAVELKGYEGRHGGSKRPSSGSSSDFLLHEQRTYSIY